MFKKTKFFLLFVTIHLLTGCVTTHDVKVDEKKDKIVFSKDLLSRTGIKRTSCIASGDFSVVKGKFSLELAGEFDFNGGISWPGIAVDAGGAIYDIRHIFVGCEDDSFQVRSVIDYCRVDGGGVSKKGAIPDTGTLKVMMFSTDGSTMFDMLGRRVDGFDPKKFNSEKGYAIYFVSEHGTQYHDLQTDDRFKNQIQEDWRPYETPGGIMYSPLDLSAMKNVAGINPEIIIKDKYIGNANIAISPDPYSTGFGFIFDAVRTINAKPKGWDNKSVIERAAIGWYVDFFDKLRTECK